MTSAKIRLRTADDLMVALQLTEIGTRMTVLRGIAAEPGRALAPGASLHAFLTPLLLQNDSAVRARAAADLLVGLETLSLAERVRVALLASVDGVEAPPFDDASTLFYLAELVGPFGQEARDQLEAVGKPAFCYLREHADALRDADRIWLLRWGAEAWPLFAAGLIARALARDGNAVALVALQSAPALGKAAVPALQALLDRFAGHADPALRLAAIQAGAKNVDWQALLTAETNPAVQRSAVQCLTQKEGATAIPVLVALLDNRDWQTRAAAGSALVGIGGASVVEAVKPLVGRCRHVQAAAVQILLALGEQAWLEQAFLAPPPLVGLVDEPLGQT